MQRNRLAIVKWLRAFPFMRLSFLGFFTILCLAFPSCVESQGEQPTVELSVEHEILDSSGNTLQARILPPKGFKRIAAPENSFAAWLRSRKVLPHGQKVLLHDGSEKYRQDVHACILDIDVGRRDLQQCADAVMRLRAEYLFEQKQYDKIHFNFTNGFRCDYSKWRSGSRVKVSGNNVSWTNGGAKDESWNSFRKYLDMVYTYAGTLSLEKELDQIDIEDLQPGDVFIRGGSPGHAVIVMDVAIDNPGKKLFLLAQSYMPAQQIHVLLNPENAEISPWYEIPDGELNTPEWTFERDQIRRFQH